MTQEIIEILKKQERELKARAIKEKLQCDVPAMLAYNNRILAIKWGWL